MSTQDKEDEGFNPEDFFEYIGHTLDHDYIRDFKVAGWNKTFKDIYYGDTLDDYVLDENRKDTKIYCGDGGIFSTVTIKGAERYREFAKDESKVTVVAPRHRSLVDFLVAQPIHYHFINKELMILSGDNLFVGPFDHILRNFGAYMFLRKKRKIKREGKPPVVLDVDDYRKIFPAYLKKQMIDGVESDPGEVVRRDEIVFPEYHVDDHGSIMGGGRTKSGELGRISSLPFLPLHRYQRQADVDVVVAPVNISMSKYPDALFLTKEGNVFNNILRNIRYIFEMNYIFYRYPHYTDEDEDAMLDVTIEYGEPIYLSDFSGKEMIGRKSESGSFSSRLRKAIGEGETVYPSTLLYRGMQDSQEISFQDLDHVIKGLVEEYQKNGVDVSEVTDGSVIYPAGDIYEMAEKKINSNPRLFFHNRKMTDRIIESDGKMIKSNNENIQRWYGGMLKHLD